MTFPLDPGVYSRVYTAGNKEDLMKFILLFFAGAFSANSLPHFINGISGREMNGPFFYRYFTWIPNPLFNTLWGLLNAFIAFLFLSLLTKEQPGIGLFRHHPWNLIVYSVGFIFASVFLSLFFGKNGWEF